jgi:hypothetical protein
MCDRVGDGDLECAVSRVKPLLVYKDIEGLASRCRKANG